MASRLRAGDTLIFHGCCPSADHKWVVMLISNLTKEQYAIRLVKPSDAEIIADQRTKLYSEIGKIKSKDQEVFRSCCEKALQQLIETNQYVGWFVENESSVVAGAGLLIRQLLPNSSNPTGCTEGYILNVYTVIEHRRRGLARFLMTTILDWCHAHKIERITLHTSDPARPLYENLGFVPTAEMRFEGS